MSKWWEVNEYNNLEFVEKRLVRTLLESKVAAWPTVPKRFWDKVRGKFGSTCWWWAGSTSKGSSGLEYGRILAMKGRTMPAHRMMYLVTWGEIDPTLEVHHKCNNTLCVNPYHLDAITKRENGLLNNGVGAVNKRKTHCKRGHEFSEANIWKYPYKRICKQCREINERNRYERKVSSRSGS